VPFDASCLDYYSKPNSCPADGQRPVRKFGPQQVQAAKAEKCKGDAECLEKCCLPVQMRDTCLEFYAAAATAGKASPCEGTLPLVKFPAPADAAKVPCKGAECVEKCCLPVTLETTCVDFYAKRPPFQGCRSPRLLNKFQDMGQAKAQKCSTDAQCLEVCCEQVNTEPSCLDFYAKPTSCTGQRPKKKFSAVDALNEKCKGDPECLEKCCEPVVLDRSCVEFYAQPEHCTAQRPLVKYRDMAQAQMVKCQNNAECLEKCCSEVTLGSTCVDFYAQPSNCDANLPVQKYKKVEDARQHPRRVPYGLLRAPDGQGHVRRVLCERRVQFGQVSGAQVCRRDRGGASRLQRCGGVRALVLSATGAPQQHVRGLLRGQPAVHEGAACTQVPTQ
jgi:hypothetical protein